MSETVERLDLEALTEKIVSKLLTKDDVGLFRGEAMVLVNDVVRQHFASRLRAAPEVAQPEKLPEPFAWVVEHHYRHRIMRLERSFVEAEAEAIHQQENSDADFTERAALYDERDHAIRALFRAALRSPRIEKDHADDCEVFAERVGNCTCGLSPSPRIEGDER